MQSAFISESLQLTKIDLGTKSVLDTSGADDVACFNAWMDVFARFGFVWF